MFVFFYPHFLPYLPPSITSKMLSPERKDVTESSCMQEEISLVHCLVRQKKCHPVDAFIYSNICGKIQANTERFFSLQDTAPRAAVPNNNPQMQIQEPNLHTKYDQTEKIDDCLFAEKMSSWCSPPTPRTEKKCYFLGSSFQGCLVFSEDLHNISSHFKNFTEHLCIIACFKGFLGHHNHFPKTLT